jgi:hypothetical protein
MYMDILDQGPLPRRGDRLRSAKTTYFVIYAHVVKRRDPARCPRVTMKAIPMDELKQGTRTALIRSAIRGHGQSCLFEFRWYPRGKKAKTFEQYMRVGNYG